MHPSTIRVYLSGISFITKLVTGAPHPFAQHSHVTLLLRSLRRNQPPNPPSRRPITSDILAGCVNTLRSGYANPAIDSTLEAMFFLAFFGFLRCAEFTASNSTFIPNRHPCLSDLTIHNSSTLRFLLKHSKTDQFGKTAPIYLFKL